MKKMKISDDFPESKYPEMGWPWSNDFSKEVSDGSLFSASSKKGNSELGASVDHGNKLPRISVITPSFNQAQYIEETIRSVLLQDYPNLEYIVIDGGSTDGTVSIIERYAGWLHYWVSEKDRGQSHAINKGFQIATGDVVAYLNSDDTYLPGALWRVAEAWQASSNSVVFVGGFVHVYEGKSEVSRAKWPALPHRGPIDISLLNHESWRLPQQSGFFLRAGFDQGEDLVLEDLHFTMDRELYCRLLKRGKAYFIRHVLATYRLHDNSKTCSSIMQMYREDAKALGKAKTGLYVDDFKRVLIGRGWIGRGYWKQVNLGRRGRVKNFLALLGAGINYPRYIGRKQFWRLLGGCFGVDTMLVKKRIFRFFRAE